MPPRVEQNREPTVQSRATSALPATNASADAFGSGAAAVLSTAGAKLEASGDRLGNRAIQMATENNETLAKEADTLFNGSMRDTLFHPQNGYLTKKGQDAYNGYEPTKAALEKARDAAAEKITSPEARKMFIEVSTRRLDVTLDTMAKHAAIERRTWIDGVSTARALNAGDDAIAYSEDAKRRDAAIFQGRNEIVTNAKDHGEDPVITERKLREFDTKTFKGIVERMATNDPIGAQKYYEENKHRIDGQQQIGVEKMLKESTGRRRAEDDANTVMSGSPTGNYGDKVGGVENGGAYGGTPNKSTNAGGRYQFTDATFLEHARAADPEGTAGKSDADLLKLKSANTKEGRDLQDKTFVRLTRENEKALKEAGVETNDATRYLAHWFGAKGALDVLKADAATPAERFFKAGKGADGKMRTPEEWAAENGIKGLTAGQVVALAQKRMGVKSTPLPDEVAVRTSTDPKEKAREIEANFAQYTDRMRELYKDDPERMDKALAVLRQRKSVAEEAFTAGQKVDHEKALQIAVTPDANGMRPTSIDAIPPDLWTRLAPEVQRSLTAILDHNLRQADRKPNPALYAELSRQIVDDPDGFKRRDLVPLAGSLPDADWKHFQGIQTALGRRENSEEEKRASVEKGLRISDAMIKSAAIYLGFADSKGKVTKAKEFDEFKNQYQTSILREMEDFQKENKRRPRDEEIQKIADRLLIQGRVRDTGIFSDTKAVQFKQKQDAGGAGFYVPYDQIPKADRDAIERQLEARKLLSPSMSGSARKKAVEDTFVEGNKK